MLNGCLPHIQLDQNRREMTNGLKSTRGALWFKLGIVRHCNILCKLYDSLPEEATFQKALRPNEKTFAVCQNRQTHYIGLIDVDVDDHKVIYYLSAL